jgi:hypothetical protein
MALLSISRIRRVGAASPRGRRRALRRAVEQLPGRIQDIGAAVVAGVGVVDDPVLEREGAQAVQLVAPEVDLRGVLRCPEVEAAARPPLLLGEDGEVEVEVASCGRDPREAPAHPAPVGLQVLEWGPGDGDERHASRRQMDDGPVEAVGGVRAARAARIGPALDGRAEHEVVDE